MNQVISGLVGQVNGKCIRCNGKGVVRLPSNGQIVTCPHCGGAGD